MKVDNITPKITFVEKGDFLGGRLWGRHILYNTHELYLLGQKSSSAPNVFSVFNKTPLVGSIEDIKPF